MSVAITPDAIRKLGQGGGADCILEQYHTVLEQTARSTKSLVLSDTDFVGG